MKLIKTKSFQLAAYVAGNPTSDTIALVLPGRLETKDYAHMRSHVDHMASLGYYAFSFDPPGTWESPGDVSIYTSENYLQAVHEVISFLGNKPTILIGHSRGGSMAMLESITNEHIIGFVSIMASALPAEPDSEWQQLGIKKFYRDLPPGTEPSQTKRTFDLPYSFFTGADNLLDDLGKCTKPKLFVLGLQDTQNTPELVKIGYDASADPKRLYSINIGHGYRYQTSAIAELNQVIADFVQDFNLAPK